MRYSIHWPHHNEFGSGSLEALPSFLATLPQAIVAVVDSSIRPAIESFLVVKGPHARLLKIPPSTRHGMPLPLYGNNSQAHPRAP